MKTFKRHNQLMFELDAAASCLEVAKEFGDEKEAARIEAEIEEKSRELDKIEALMEERRD